MSNEAVGAAFKCQTKLHTEKLVLISLADHHNRSTGRCFPKVSTIMSDAQVSRATAFRCLASLEKQKLVKKNPTFDDNGRQQSTEYQLLFLGSQVETARVSDCDPRGSHGATLGGLNMDTPLKGTGRRTRKNEYPLTPASGEAQAAPAECVREDQPPSGKQTAKLEPAESASTARATESSGKPKRTRKANAKPAYDRHPDFIALFAAYPARRGAKAGKAESLAYWLTMPEDDRAAAASKLEVWKRLQGEYPVDLIRYLKRRLWDDVPDAQSDPAMESTQVKCVALDLHSNTWARSVRWWKSKESVPQRILNGARELMESWAPIGEAAPCHA